MSNHCEFCDYVTSNPSSLLNHIKAVHEKVKRFHCDLCDYACYYGYDLKKHQKLHESNPLFEGKEHLWTTKKLQNKNSNHDEKCNFCDFTVKNPSTLLNHIKAVHEKVKRFYCDLCDYACYYSPDLTKHKKFHESNPLFKARNYVGRTKNSLNSEKNQEDYKRKHGEDLSEDLTKYTRDSVKEKIYYTLPRPKRGKWIVIVERL